MTQILKIAALFNAVLLYCLLAGGTAAAPVAVSKFSDTDQRADGSISSPGLPYAVVQTKNTGNAFPGAASFFPKSLSGGISVCPKTNLRLFTAVFLQYSFYARHLLVRLQRTDVIFPFHYFW